jgi:hypothetical protein
VRVLVAGSEVTGAPAAASEGCRRLVRGAGLEVGEVLLAEGAVRGGWVCAGLTPVPSLGSPEHVEALADHLERRAGTGRREPAGARSA